MESTKSVVHLPHHFPEVFAQSKALMAKFLALPDIKPAHLAELIRDLAHTTGLLERPELASFQPLLSHVQTLKPSQAKELCNVTFRFIV